MSNVSTQHDVVPFVSGETVALSNQRLAKVGYKNTDKTPAKFPSIAVSVPYLQPEQITGNITALLPYIGDMLEAVQDKIIRSRYEISEGKLKTVSDSDISVQSCIAFMASEAEGDRLTKATLETWFDSVMAESVFVLMAEKLGFTSDDPSPAQSVRIGQSVDAYRELISSLAGGKTVLIPKQIAALKVALDAIETDEISLKLDARLAAMEKKIAKDTEIASLL